MTMILFHRGTSPLVLRIPDVYPDTQISSAMLMTGNDEVFYGTLVEAPSTSQDHGMPGADERERVVEGIKMKREGKRPCT